MYGLGLVLNLIPIIGVAIIGAVMAPRAGAAKSKMWLGLTLLIIGSLVSLAWQAMLIVPSLHSVLFTRAAAIGVIGAAVGVIGSALFVAGVYVLCAAVIADRGASGYLDPSRPGAPPSTYENPGRQGTRYPQPGQKPADPGANPYL